MGRAKSPAEDLLNGVIQQGVTPLLKAAQFRKSGMSYHRRHGETTQVINVQVSHGSFGEEKRFYVNVGIAFDAICELVGVPGLEKPKEYECDARGTRGRIGEFICNGADIFTVRAGQDTDDLIRWVQRGFEELLANLNQIDGPSAYRSHRWFDRSRPRAENAQIFYVLGDLKSALSDVKALAALFADRQNAGAERWVEELGLVKLKVKGRG